MWFTLHAIARGYPESPSLSTRRHARNFMLALPSMIPCEKCSEHARTFLELNTQALERAVRSRSDMERFIIDLHNHANVMTGKSRMSLAQARALYSSARFTYTAAL